ncbi:MAG: hypothetical protein V7646_6157, partial [Pseudonocardia sp.]
SARWLDRWNWRIGILVHRLSSLNFSNSHRVNEVSKDTSARDQARSAKLPSQLSRWRRRARRPTWHG